MNNTELQRLLARTGPSTRLLSSTVSEEFGAALNVHDTPKSTGTIDNLNAPQKSRPTTDPITSRYTAVTNNPFSPEHTTGVNNPATPRPAAKSSGSGGFNSSNPISPYRTHICPRSNAALIAHSDILQPIFDQRCLATGVQWEIARLITIGKIQYDDINLETLSVVHNSSNFKAGKVENLLCSSWDTKRPQGSETALIRDLSENVSDVHLRLIRSA